MSTVWRTLDMYPTLPVLISDIGASLATTACAALWMMHMAEDPFKYQDEQKARSDQ